MQRIVLIIAMAGCETAASRDPVQPTAPAGELDARFVGAMRTAAAQYQAWGRVDDTPRMAPTLCAAAAPMTEPSQVRLSAAEIGPHGKKLYYLWASDRHAYRNPTQFPVGFTIVKESYAAVATSAAPARTDDQPIQSLITEGGERLMIGARKDLFVMTKVGETAGTDAGWVYGTVAVDGTVTSAGRVASCMGCHVSDAPHERLFGLAPAPKH